MINILSAFCCVYLCHKVRDLLVVLFDSKESQFVPRLFYPHFVIHCMTLGTFTQEKKYKNCVYTN